MDNPTVLPSPPGSGLVPALKGELTMTVHSNMAQQIIVITEDKAYKCLRIWSDGIADRNAWIAPVTLFVSMMFTLVTTDFRDVLGVPRDTWQAIGMIAIVAAGIWMVIELLKLARRGKGNTVDDLIAELKRGANVKNMDGAELKTHLDNFN